MSVEMLKAARNTAEVQSSLSDSETKKSYNTILTTYLLDKIPESALKNNKTLFTSRMNNIFGENSLETAIIEYARKSANDKNKLSKNINKVLEDMQKDPVMERNLNYLFLDKINKIDKSTIIKESVSPDFAKKISKIPTSEKNTEEQIKELEKFLKNKTNESDFIKYMNNYTLNKIENYSLNTKKGVETLLKDVQNGKIAFSDSERNLQICLESSCAQYLKDAKDLNKKTLTGFNYYLGSEIKNSYDLGQSYMMKTYFENLTNTYKKPNIIEYNLDEDPNPLRKKKNKDIMDSYAGAGEFHPLLTNTNKPALPRDLLSGKDYHDFQNVVAYCKNAGVPFVVFGDVNFLMDKKNHWFEGKANDLEKNSKKGRFPCNIVDLGKDRYGNPMFAMVTPTKMLNQAVVPEGQRTNDKEIAPNTQIPENPENKYPVVLNSPKDAENFLIANQANYINASKTGLPYNALSHEGNQEHFVNLLAEAVNQNKDLFTKVNYLSEKLANMEKLNNNITLENANNIQNTLPNASLASLDDFSNLPDTSSNTLSNTTNIQNPLSEEQLIERHIKDFKEYSLKTDIDNILLKHPEYKPNNYERLDSAAKMQLHEALTYFDIYKEAKKYLQDPPSKYVEMINDIVKTSTNGRKTDIKTPIEFMGHILTPEGKMPENIKYNHVENTAMKIIREKYKENPYYLSTDYLNTTPNETASVKPIKNHDDRRIESIIQKYDPATREMYDKLPEGQKPSFRANKYEYDIYAESKEKGVNNNFVKYLDKQITIASDGEKKEIKNFNDYREYVDRMPAGAGNYENYNYSKKLDNAKNVLITHNQKENKKAQKSGR